MKHELIVDHINKLEQIDIALENHIVIVDKMAIKSWIKKMVHDLKSVDRAQSIPSAQFQSH